MPFPKIHTITKTIFKSTYLFEFKRSKTITYLSELNEKQTYLKFHSKSTCTFTHKTVNELGNVSFLRDIADREHNKTQILYTEYQSY